ncbi:hypothetical protein [Ramlibacter albus]|uniref:Uncharacterized protein n=1 Tax=Ramlibacter albus TaxID=2079448 RepID=A0A923M2T2_9BURK|nr:hypothetical protein [Ramlibacter albus]MBC5762855.1 hypothetical protein [Ramlibacter albus]
MQEPVNSRLWVEPVGNIIVARLRGPCTSDLLLECQNRVLTLARDSGIDRVLYDALEMDVPSDDLVFLQQRLEDEKRAALGSAGLRTAILVPNTRIALLARIAFGAVGESHYRVFYSAMLSAVRWLEEAHE